MKTGTNCGKIPQLPVLMVADIEGPPDRFYIVAMVDNDFEPLRCIPVSGHKRRENKAQEFGSGASELPKTAIGIGEINTTKRAEMAH